ncbi:MAG: sensor domain-containing diguanylate cyclase [Candidatus Omnitrophica bacterium]|jgi:diguanylate cyclase (GGDEF)-like protein|nr:sensor domain-containing diguanylate cyclase [Candidatus Omnitrophota bacterium]
MIKKVWAGLLARVTFLKKRPRRKPVYAVIFISAYLAVPIYFASVFCPRPFLLLFVFYLVNAVVFAYLLHKHGVKNAFIQYRRQSSQEEINLQSYDNSRELQNQVALREKIRRYSNLKKVIEEINTSLTMESIAENLSESAFSYVGRSRGNCVLYVVDKQSHYLSLFKTKKEDKRMIIKTKQGDIFDHWVLRHTSPLFIEDISQDFRFDLNKFRKENDRPVGSLISAPLVSGNKFLGILRLDYPKPKFYSQDDLRFLVSICDLGALALENGELYQRTEDLAIHDGLTGVFTKGHFMELLKVECKRSIRHNRPFSLLMLDIDHFKDYNDKFGHAAGDIVLTNICRVITGHMTERGVVVSRFGGEEFCVVLPGCSKEQALQAAEALRRAVETARITLRRQDTNVTVSVGVATFLEDTSDEIELIMKADKAMYEAKQKGRNQVR